VISFEERWWIARGPNIESDMPDGFRSTSHSAGYNCHPLRQRAQMLFRAMDGNNLIQVIEQCLNRVRLMAVVRNIRSFNEDRLDQRLIQAVSASRHS
jgi:hypothetical protein